jgi:hypothetical protein
MSLNRRSDPAHRQRARYGLVQGTRKAVLDATVVLKRPDF